MIIAVPLYRSPDLLDDLFGSLKAMADEIRGLPAQLLLINDSPDDEPLAAALDRLLPELSGAIDIELLTNPGNLGFVRTANRAFQLGIEWQADILLLNSDARPRPGAFAEMAAVAALDPMIGFVSPRSDNATLCDSPYPAAWRAGSPDQSFQHHRLLERHLPRYSYAPTAVGFCLLVRHRMIEEFGFFDEIYDGGYNEENDLIRRCNRRGYRAVLANHAYVHHLGGASFAASPTSSAERETRNRAILIHRYPEYPLAVQRFFEGADHRAQRLLAGLVPLPDGKLRILFDCRTLECSHKGTFEHSRRLLAAIAPLAAGRFDLFVLCERAAFEFHGLDDVPGLRFCEREDVHDRPFAIAMRLVQPFLLEDIVSLADYAPVTGFLILDTIAMDCQQLDTHGLDALWRFMVEAVSLIGFNSAFTRDQFRRRIDMWPHVTEFVSRCSTDVVDYATPGDDDEQDGHILIVGNDYPHKHVADTVAAIESAVPKAKIVSLGLSDARAQGSLGDDEVDTLYRDAALVVFPSHYEGFGLPIMHALARRKPVIARDLPPAREIAERSAAAAGNLHLAATTAEIADMVRRGFRWQPFPPAMDNPAEGWTTAAQAVLDAFDLALKRFDFATCRRQQAAIIGHRARLEAERRFHDNATDTTRLQDEIRSTAEQLASGATRNEDLKREIATLHISASESIARANDLEVQRDTARHEAALAREQALQARSETMDAVAVASRAEKRVDHAEKLLAALLDAPTFPTPAKAAERGKASLTEQFAAWLRARSDSAIRARFSETVPRRTPGSAAELQLNLTARPAHPAQLMDTLLDWIDLLGVGSRFRVRLEDGLSPPEDDVRALLLALGCLTTRIAPYRHHVALSGIKLWTARWPAGPDDDALFLQAAYRTVLQRQPDTDAITHYLTEIAGGATRDAIVGTLLTSRERFDLVAARLAMGDRPQR